ncbi:MAG: ferritin [Ignavibacteriales bacterium]|nr:ferritin [Ignavibacteriales bacterium]
MIPKSVLKALREQIRKELYSAYYYLSMSAYFTGVNLSGFAHWMRKQYQEETSHALKVYDYIHERGGKVILESIDKPPSEFKSPLDVMTKVLEHERSVTASITALYELAVREKDYPTQIMLDWFIKEQVEEERSVDEIVNLLKMIGDAPAGLIMLDRQLASRGS